MAVPVPKDESEAAPSAAPSMRYSCSACSATFSLRKHLKRHERIHFDQHRFRCDQCDRHFTRMDHLRAHLFSHSGKTFSCSCGKAYVHESSLKRHIKTSGHTPAPDNQTMPATMDTSFELTGAHPREDSKPQEQDLTLAGGNRRFRLQSDDAASEPLVQPAASTMNPPMGYGFNPQQFPQWMSPFAMPQLPQQYQFPQDRMNPFANQWFPPMPALQMPMQMQMQIQRPPWQTLVPVPPMRPPSFNFAAEASAAPLQSQTSTSRNSDQSS